MHLRVDDEPRGVERVGEDPMEGQVPGARLSLVRQEAQHGLRRPLRELELGVARAPRRFPEKASDSRSCPAP